MLFCARIYRNRQTDFVTIADWRGCREDHHMPLTKVKYDHRLTNIGSRPARASAQHPAAEIVLEADHLNAFVEALRKTSPAIRFRSSQK